MITSMTGYAENRLDHKKFSACVTLKTLNHRYFDWNYQGDRIGDIEDRLRKICKEHIYRGRVDVFLDIHFIESSRFEVHINKNYLKKIYDSLKEIEGDIQENIKIRLEDLFDIPHLIEIKNRDFSKEERDFLEKAFRMCLNKLIKERKKEGERLLKGIRRHLERINSEVDQIEKMAENQPDIMEKKLRERIRRLSQEGEISEEKIAEETALYAQKYDLNEEIERLKSHLHHFGSLLSGEEKEPAGKKLDFTSQEILRETNTINSKSQEIKIAKSCLSIKSELESIRQQIRNLE
ncbi:MAG: YicC/YloC family endoribonuclease [Acidobacteriota bacterium]